jgi:hypothetical protein
MLGVLIRAVAYASLFIGVVLVYLPAQTLSRAGIARPRDLGPAQAVGGVAVFVGAALALWCIAAFAFVGRGTPLRSTRLGISLPEGRTGTFATPCISVRLLRSRVHRSSTKPWRLLPMPPVLCCSCTCSSCSTKNQRWPRPSAANTRNTVDESAGGGRGRGRDIMADRDLIRCRRRAIPHRAFGRRGRHGSR